MDGPAGVAIGDDGTIYVVETGSSRISVYGADGALIRRFGGPGIEPGRLQSPQAVGIGPGGALFVADSGNHRIQVLGPDGAPRRAWGTDGTAPGQFNEPSGIPREVARSA